MKTDMFLNKIEAMINFITNTLNINKLMLAQILHVTEATIPFWINEPSKSLTIRRLYALDYVLYKAILSNIPNESMLHLLDKSFEPFKEDSSCLLNLIVEDNLNIDDFKLVADEKIKKFKEHYGF